MEANEKKAVSATAHEAQEKSRKKIIYGVAAALIIIMAAAPFLAQIVADILVDRWARQFIARSNLPVTVDYDTIHFNIWSRKLTLDGFQVIDASRSKIMHVKEIQVKRFDRKGVFPSELTMVFDGFSATVSAFLPDALKNAAEQVGIPTVSGVVRVDLEYDAVAESMHLKRFSGEFVELGTIGAEFVAEGVSGKSFGSVVRSLPSAQVTEIWLSYKGTILADRVITRFADAMALETMVARDRVLTGLDRRIQRTYRDDERMRSVLISVKRYLDSPGTLTAQLMDDEIITLGDLFNFNGVTGFRGIIRWFEQLPLEVSAS